MIRGHAVVDEGVPGFLVVSENRKGSLDGGEEFIGAEALEFRCAYLEGDTAFEAVPFQSRSPELITGAAGPEGPILLGSRCRRVETRRFFRRPAAQDNGSGSGASSRQVMGA